MKKKIRQTCREEMLSTIRSLVLKKGKNEFTVKEIITAMHVAGTSYKDSTIRTHLISKCCVGKPRHHQTRYEDYRYLDRGLYALVNPIN